jgi:hypothetical protein
MTTNQQTLDPNNDAHVITDQVENAAAHLEHFGTVLMEMAFLYQQPEQNLTLTDLRGIALFMSSASHMLNQFAQRYWSMIPIEHRLVPCDDPPVVQVVRSKR